MSNITKTSSAIRYAELLTQGVEGFVKAGQLAKQEIADDPEWPERAAEELETKYPGITAAVIARSVKFADCHPSLIFNENPGPRALRNCEPSLQSKYVKDGIPLLLSDGQNLLVNVNNLTHDQAKQVFDGKQIRDLAAQRAWIESQKTTAAIKMAPVKSDLPYRIVKGEVVILKLCKFTRKQIANIMVELE